MEITGVSPKDTISFTSAMDKTGRGQDGTDIVLLIIRDKNEIKSTNYIQIIF